MRLSVRTADRTLRATQWIIILCTVWVGVQTVFLKERLPQPRLVNAGVMVTPTRQTDAAVRDLDKLAGLWKRDLRQTLIEPKPKPKPAPKPPPPPKPPRLPKLLATFVERGSAWGLFVDERGGHRVKRAGATIDGVEIESIGRGSARLRKGNRTFEIGVPVRK